MEVLTASQRLNRDRSKVIELLADEPRPSAAKMLTGDDAPRLWRVFTGGNQVVDGSEQTLPRHDWGQAGDTHVAAHRQSRRGGDATGAVRDVSGVRVITGCWVEVRR